MTSPLTSSSPQLDSSRLSIPATVILEALAFPERGYNEKRAENDLLSSASPGPQLNLKSSGAWFDLMSARAWRNHVVWRAGVIEGVASGSLNFLSGLFVATLTAWPLAAVPAGILVGNTVLVSLIISATVSTTGGHINSLITMATAFSGLCRPVRAIIYMFFQVAGGALGGTLLRIALGTKLANEIHNASCWIEPEGEVDVWQAVLIEFTSAFILLFLGYGLGLDPRQAKVFGVKYGPMLVGLLVGILTSFTATVHVGYTGAGMFPGRCFGLAAGIGEFQKSHWVWWAPDIFAAALYAFFYATIQKPCSGPAGMEN